MTTNGYCGKHASQFKRHGTTFTRTEKDLNEIREQSTWAEIDLYDRRGNVKVTTIIDVEDIPRVSHLKWSWCNGYVHNKKTSTYLHRLITCAMLNDEVDHIDRDRLNNTKSNLRFCTHSQNHANKRAGSGKFKGVYFDKSRRKYMARIKVSGKTVHLGRFDCEKAAAHAYNKRAIELFGEFSLQNEVLYV